MKNLVNKIIGIGIMITVNSYCFAQSMELNNTPTDLSGRCISATSNDKFEIIGIDSLMSFGVFMKADSEAFKKYGISIRGQYNAIYIHGPGMSFRFKTEIKKGTLLDFSFKTQKTDTKPVLEWLCIVQINEDIM